MTTKPPKDERPYRSVQWRIMVRQLPLIFLLVVGVLYWFGDHLKEALYSNNLELARRSGYLAVSAVQAFMEGRGTHRSWGRIDASLSQDKNTQIQIVNVLGEVIYASDPENRDRVYHLSDAACSPCHTGGSVQAETQSTFVHGPGDEAVQVYAAPLLNTDDCRGCHETDSDKLGMVFVRQSLAPVNQLIQTAQIGLVIAGTIVLVLTVAMWRILFGRYIGLPLGRLVTHARAIGSGDLESRIELPHHTELTVLGETLNNSAKQLNRTIQQVTSQRDDLATLYKISDQLARSVGPDDGGRRAVELASSIFGSDCILVAGHFHTESHAFHGTVTYRGEGGEIEEHPYPEEAVKTAAPYFDPDIVEQWIDGSLDGEIRIRKDSTVAYPLERRGRRLGVILAPSRRPEDTADGRATAAHPDVVQALRKHLTIALELNELQRERLQRERLTAIGATVAGLAHSLKNGLNSLRGGQYIVEHALKTDNPKNLLEGWKIVKRGMQHIERLSQDMLFFTVDRAPDLKLVDPNEILREILDLFQESAADQGVKILADFDEKMQPLPLDRKAMRRAILNLTSNAIDGCIESDTGDTVILRSRCKSDSVVITVEDNGVGIPEQQLKRVTERFFTTKGSKGTGLGLPVALKIAENHKGMLEVESVVGEKTFFHLRIPRDLDA